MSEDKNPIEEPQVFAVERDLGGGWTFQRRDLLKGAALAATGGALVGCGGGNDKKSSRMSIRVTPAGMIPTYEPTQTGFNCVLNHLAHEGDIKHLVTTTHYLLSVGGEQAIKLWSIPGLTWLRTVEIASISSIYSIAASETQVAAGQSDGTISLWSLPDGAPLRTVSAPGVITALALSPDNRILAAGSEDGTLTVWSGELNQTLSGHEFFLTCLAITPDGTLLASADMSGVIRLWSLPDGALLQTIPAAKSKITTLAISPDGTRLASGDDLGKVKLWTLPGGELEHTEQAHREVSYLFTLAESRQLVSFGTDDRQIKRWSFSDGQMLDSWRIDADYITSLAVTPDGTQVLVASSDGALRLWSADTKSATTTCAIDPNRRSQDVLLVGTLASGETIALPCGSELPAGAVCICNCVTAASYGVDCGCVGHHTGAYCSCDTVCTCDTVCGCNADTGGSSGGGGGHYWHPN